MLLLALRDINDDDWDAVGVTGRRESVSSIPPTTAFT
jgi:hypothetical protein